MYYRIFTRNQLRNVLRSEKYQSAQRVLLRNMNFCPEELRILKELVPATSSATIVSKQKPFAERIEADDGYGDLTVENTTVVYVNDAAICVDFWDERRQRYSTTTDRRKIRMHLKRMIDTLVAW